MNRQLLLKALEELEQNKKITIEEIASLAGNSFAEAYEVMTYLIREKIIGEETDGIFFAITTGKKIQSLLREKENYFRDFSAKELSEKFNKMEEKAFKLLCVVKDEPGITVERIQEQINSDKEEIRLVLQKLIQIGFVTMFEERYYCTLHDEEIDVLTASRKKTHYEESRSNLSRLIGRIKRKLENRELLEDDDLDEEDKIDNDEDDDTDNETDQKGLDEIISQIANSKNRDESNEEQQESVISQYICMLGNEQGNAFPIDLDIFETPLELIQRAIEETPQEVFEVLLKEKEDYSVIKNDINGIDKKKTKIYALENKKKIPLSLDTTFIEQIELDCFEETADNYVLPITIKIAVLKRHKN